MQCYPSKYIHPLAWYNLRKGGARHPQIRSSHLGKHCVASALHTFGRLWRGETSSYSVFFLLLITSFPTSQKKNHFSIHMQAPRLSPLGSWGHGRGEAGRVRREKESTRAQRQCAPGGWVFLKEKKTLCTKKPTTSFLILHLKARDCCSCAMNTPSSWVYAFPFTTGSLVPRVEGWQSCPCVETSRVLALYGRAVPAGSFGSSCGFWILEKSFWFCVRLKLNMPEAWWYLSGVWAVAGGLDASRGGGRGLVPSALGSRGFCMGDKPGALPWASCKLDLKQVPGASAAEGEQHHPARHSPVSSSR